ncbi:MAG: hypothetical protein R3B07_06955 [Polyangiaceae bacterium]
MARMTVGDKARRVVTFLHGLANPRAASVLAAFGFTQKDLDEGWELLKNMRAVRVERGLSIASPHTLRDLDEWENRWFPVVKASLQRHYPAIHDSMFLNLSQTEGLDVVNSVGVFLERLAKLEAKADAESKAARKLLTQRGLTAPVVKEANNLLETISTIREEPTPVAPTAEEVDEREAAVWAWYLEWSAIAQANISDRNTLRALGFLQTRRGSKSEAEDDSTSSTEQPSVAV